MMMMMMMIIAVDVMMVLDRIYFKLYIALSVGCLELLSLNRCMLNLCVYVCVFCS